MISELILLYLSISLPSSKKKKGEQGGKKKEKSAQGQILKET